MVECLHCGERYRSDSIRYILRYGDNLWWCPTDGCDGAGFGFDILSYTDSLDVAARSQRL